MPGLWALPEVGVPLLCLSVHMASLRDGLGDGDALAWAPPGPGSAPLRLCWPHRPADSGSGGTGSSLTSSAGESPVARADGLHLSEPGPRAVLISKTVSGEVARVQGWAGFTCPLRRDTVTTLSSALGPHCLSGTFLPPGLWSGQGQAASPRPAARFRPHHPGCHNTCVAARYTAL